jgi:hypothetical protein
MEASFSLPLLVLVLASTVTANTNTTCSSSKGSVYDYQLKDLYGKQIEWSDYKHNILLVVNTATF